MSNVAGVSIAAFGLLNAVAITASAAFLATAVAVADDDSLAPAGDAAATVGLLYQLSSNAWGIGALFFGLWLIPMGWAAITTSRFPAALGWILIAGGVGYMLSSFVLRLRQSAEPAGRRIGFPRHDRRVLDDRVPVASRHTAGADHALDVACPSSHGLTSTLRSR